MSFAHACVSLPHCISLSHMPCTDLPFSFCIAAVKAASNLLNVSCRMRTEAGQKDLLARIRLALSHGNLREAKKLMTDYSTHPVDNAFYGLGEASLIELF